MSAALGLGLLLVAGEASRGPRDDPDPARQRPGFLDAGELPAPAPPLTHRVSSLVGPAVVFFTEDPANLCRELAKSRLEEKADLILVVRVGREACPYVQVSDADGQVARAYDMPRPSKGGFPVGYAVVDNKGMIRYRTLDPRAGHHLPEVRTIVEATT